jgi:nucleoside-diphosphate-sugar epimerase
VETVVCFGLGYTGARVARALAARGWRVRGTRRAPPAGDDPLAAGGVEVAPFAEGARLLEGATHVLSTVPPGPEGEDPVLEAHGPALARAAARGAWLGYVSSTAVYGDRRGAWVDAASPPRRRARAGGRAWRPRRPGAPSARSTRSAWRGSTAPAAAPSTP